MDIIQQLRAFLDQLDPAGAPQAAKQKLLPRDPNPRPTMPLSEDGHHFTAPWWMEGYPGALAGVRLADWGNEYVAIQGMGGQGGVIPGHFRVLVPNAGQVHVSPADLGWIDATGYDPRDYPDIEARRAAWIKVGCPTAGPRGKFDVRGDYVTPGAWEASSKA